MRKIFFIAICLLCFGFNAFANDLLKKAEKAYDSKKYKAAITNYEELVKKGYTSYQLYFNLGNAYYRNNELGKAIYFYELARKLEPDDEDVRVNLAIASSKTVDKIDAKENFFISAVKTNLLSSFSTTTWALLTIFSLLLASALFFVFVSSSMVHVKRLSFIFSMIFVILFILTYFLGYSAVESKSENKFAIITAREVRVMNEPTGSGISKFSLHEGTKIRVAENNGDWLLIQLDNGNEGWVKTADVGII
jgi:tetratricopeptide (TPR) repeat protein